MNKVRIVALIVIALMGASFVNVAVNSGFDHGVGFDTFLDVALYPTKDPWQYFIDNDMSTGLLFMAAWMIFRERGGRRISTISWVWMATWWGNVIVAFYVLRAIYQSEGDWQKFFMGPGGALRSFVTVTPALKIVLLLAAAGLAVYTGMEIMRVREDGIAVFGYLCGFVPVVLSLIAIAGSGERQPA